MMKTILKAAIVCAIVLVVFVSFSAIKTKAVPSFARESGVACSTCHTQWPQLNEYGRDFKESGYNTAGDVSSVASGLKLDEKFPVAGALNLRFIDKRTSSNTVNEDLNQGQKQLKLRSGHELELFLAGRASERISFFAELEAEDEWPDPAGDAPGFQVQVATAVAEYRCKGGVTFTGGFGNVFHADGYNTLHHHKVARKDWGVSGNIPDEAQFISISGRPSFAPKVFALAALSGNDGDLEGHDARDYSFRLAVDVMPGIMVGGFANLGRTYEGDPIWRSKDQVDRGGLDFQIDKGQLHVNGVWSRKHDYTRDVGQDVPGTWETFAGLEVQYVVEDEEGRPLVVPYAVFDYYAMDIMARQDSLHTQPRDKTGYGLFVSYFLSENAKAQVGVEGTLAAANVFYGYEHKEMRWTIVGHFGF